MKRKIYTTMLAAIMAANLSLSAAAAPLGRTELKMGLSSSVQDKVQPTKRYSKEQLKAVEQEIKKLKKSYEDISDCKIDEKKNRVVVTVVGTVVPKLKNALANIPNKNAVEVVVVPDEDGFGGEDNDEEQIYCIINTNLDIVVPFRPMDDVKEELRRVVLRAKQNEGGF